jgi:TrmH family RNA methyltransferase
VITSLKNPRVAEALKLRKRGLREDRREFLVEGPQALGEAVASGGGLSVLFHTPEEHLHGVVGRAREAGVPLVEVSEDVVRHLTSTVTPQGLVGVARFVDLPLAELSADLTLAAILHAVRDPGNAGTVLRSADAADAQAVVFTSSSVDVYNPKAVRSSAGSLFHLPVVREVPVEDAVAELRRRGLAVYAATTSGDRELFDLDLTAPTALLFGNEAWGLPEEVAALADTTVRVPISPRAESLNLAAAATVCLFEAVRQRSSPGGQVDLASLVAGAAHDIRSPLTAVRGFATTMLNRWATMRDEDREAMLGAIAADARRMNGVLRELVDAARAATGGLELSSERIDPADVVRRAVEAASARAEFPAVEQDVDAPPFLADPARLQGAVEAMLEAAAWWGEEGPIHVAVRRRGDAVEINVGRTGTRLTPEAAAALLAPRAAGSGGGSKLGLFVAGAVAEAHAGTLRASVEDGIAFQLSLPIA